MTDTPSSPAQGFSTLQEELAYYKSQYAQLEVELQEFQASSRELEAELERDIDASEKRERTLKEKVEALNYEVDEWKTKYKQSKAEATAAQTTLQKEITSLRDTNRTTQLKLRDIEVANDDFERQARNTTSSLEDMESKYNVALERGVLLEEEMKTGEQEREALRIETQRLRDELSDLKVEAEITQEKLRRAESAAHPAKRSSGSTVSKSRGPHSPGSDKSMASTMSTPPAPKSETSASDALTPPSPALSETSANIKPTSHLRTPSMAKTPTPADSNTTPRPGHYTGGRPRHTRGPSLLPNAANTPSYMRSTAARSGRPSGVSQEPLPRSGSLYQIRGLIGKMQKLEERVQSARSKLPAPTNTPPNASPRGSTLSQPPQIPSSVTIRSTKKRPSTATASATTPSRSGRTDDDAASGRASVPASRRSRLSYGMSTPGGGATGAAAGGDPSTSRPSSRASNASHQFARPSSRASISGLRAMAEGYTAPRRPRSSLAGDYVYAEEESGEAIDANTSTPTPAAPSGRRSTLDRHGMSSMASAIPAPMGSGLRRQSGGVGSAAFGASTSSTSAFGSSVGPAGSGLTPARKRSALPLRPSGVGLSSAFAAGASVSSNTNHAHASTNGNGTSRGVGETF